MLGKRIFTFLATIALVAASTAMFAAFEAHVINVTAHIENALKVDTTPIEFGTVFPQEYTERAMKVGLSDSFMKQDRINDVEYKIVQKPKPMPKADAVGIVQKTLTANVAAGATTLPLDSVNNLAVGDDVAIGYHGTTMERGVIKAVGATSIDLAAGVANPHLKGELVVVVYKDLCKFLSKMPDTDVVNDTGVPSYYHPAGATGQPAFCEDPINHIATGILKNYGDPRDLLDAWTIDLKVPPVKGYVGQDWPVSCQNYVVEKDGENYGCDLWIEVTGFTKDGYSVSE